MKHYTFLFFLFICLVVSCSKDGAATDAASVGTGGSLARFIIVDNYLYIANSGDLRVFDISNNGYPVEKDPVYLGWGVETIFSYNNNLFLGSANGIFIFSLSNPDRPVLAGQAQHLRSCDPVVANDSFAYSTLKGGSPCGPATEGLYTYNILDVTNPVLLSTLELSTPLGLAVNGKIVYACRESNGLSIIDVTNPKKPAIKKTIADADFKDVIVYNQLLICYVSTGIKLYDISVPDAPVYLSTVAN